MVKTNILCFNGKFYKQKTSGGTGQNIFYETSNLPFGLYNVFVYDDNNMKSIDSEGEMEQEIEHSGEFITISELDMDFEEENEEEAIMGNNEKRYILELELFDYIKDSLGFIDNMYPLSEIVSSDSNLEFQLVDKEGTTTEYMILDNMISMVPTNLEINELNLDINMKHYFDIEGNGVILSLLFKINIYSFLLIIYIIFSFFVFLVSYTIQQNITINVNDAKKTLKGLQKQNKKIKNNIITVKSKMGTHSKAFRLLPSQIYKEFQPFYKVFENINEISPIIVNRKLVEDKVTYTFSKTLICDVYQKNDIYKIIDKINEKSDGMVFVGKDSQKSGQSFEVTISKDYNINDIENFINEYKGTDNDK